MHSNQTQRVDAPRPTPPAADDPRSDEIRLVALEIVARKGYDAVTMDEIAAEAAASKRTLYRRWPSKADMIVDAVRHNTHQMEEPGNTGSLRGDLVVLLEVVSSELNRDADLVIALVAAARRHDELMRIVSAQLRDPGEIIGRRPIERAIERGELPPGSSTRLVAQVAMPMLLHRLLWQEPLDDAFVCFVVDDVLLPLLRVDATRR